MKDFFRRYAIIFVQNVDIVCVCICNLMDFACAGGYDIGIFDFVNKILEIGVRMYAWF